MNRPDGREIKKKSHKNQTNEFFIIILFIFFLISRAQRDPLFVVLVLQQHPHVLKAEQRRDFFGIFM